MVWVVGIGLAVIAYLLYEIYYAIIHVSRQLAGLSVLAVAKDRPDLAERYASRLSTLIKSR
jgi:hypothetical protein